MCNVPQDKITNVKKQGQLMDRFESNELGFKEHPTFKEQRKSHPIPLYKGLLSKVMSVSQTLMSELVWWIRGTLYHNFDRLTHEYAINILGFNS